MKERKYHVEINGETLEETDARAYFECKIIDKALFYSESDNDIPENDLEDTLSPKQLNGKELSIK